MTTRTELITSISSALHSYTGVHEQVTSLASSVSDSSLTISCTNADGAKRGIAEISDELVYVDSVSGNDLVIKGKVFGTMPITARPMTPSPSSRLRIEAFWISFSDCAIGRAMPNVTGSQPSNP